MLRALDDSTVLDRYIAIKAKIAELEEELENLKPEILYALMNEPEEKAEYKGFAFAIQRRKTYSYSDKVQELEQVLKEAKAVERQEGIASIEKDQAVLVLRSTPKPS